MPVLRRDFLVQPFGPEALRVEGNVCEGTRRPQSIDREEYGLRELGERRIVFKGVTNRDDLVSSVAEKRGGGQDGGQFS